ncbi:MAG TPA: hypothetical protein VFB80_00270 [Pirellulaceae bacterium]|nr:hypothetical protein [Pirellulaceae bacterium]
MPMRRPRPVRRRRGVILMVVLSLLTLFAIVGISFVFQAQRTASAEAAANWRQVREAAPIIERDLLEALAGETDVSGSYSALQGLDLTSSDLRAAICAAARAEQDPKERRRLERLCDLADDLRRAISLLQWLLGQVEQQATFPPG